MIVVEAEFATCGCVSGSRDMWFCISGVRYMCAIACKLFFPHIDSNTNSCTISSLSLRICSYLHRNASSNHAIEHECNMSMRCIWMISYSILGNTWYTYVCMWTKISFLIHTFCLASHAVAAALALLSVEYSRLTPLLSTPYLKLLLPL